MEQTIIPVAERSVTFDEDNQTIIHYPCLNCSFCGTMVSAACYNTTKKNVEELLGLFTKHMLNCGLKKAEELKLDISNELVKDWTINDVVFDSSDESDEDYIGSDSSDDEMEDEEMECLEERLENDSPIVEEQPNNDDNDIALKFKFMSGLNLEGKFKNSDSINLVSSWISIKAGMPKESISIRVNNQILDGNISTTLGELNIKTGSLINCYCRL